MNAHKIKANRDRLTSTGHDFIELSEQTQESVSRPSFIEVYRTTDKARQVIIVLLGAQSQ